MRCDSTENVTHGPAGNVCQRCLDAPEPSPAPQPRPVPESPKETPSTKPTPDRHAETPGPRPIPGTVNEPLANPTAIAAPFGRTKDGKPRLSPAGRKPSSNRVRLAYVNLNPETLDWLQANADPSPTMHKAEAIGRAIDKAVQSAITHEHCNLPTITVVVS